jgi:hypothetical protein
MNLPDLDGLRNKAFFVGIAGAAALASGFASGSEQFFRSYLIGFIYWLIIATTCNALLCLHHLVGGQWGVVIRRLLETGGRTIWLNALFAIPILLNLPKLYEWARPEIVAHDKILLQKVKWLNPQFFTIRVAIYFAIWLIMAYLLNKWSSEQEAATTIEQSEIAKDKLRNLSGPGIVIHMLTLTFAAFDFGMSLEPHWFSTMYGVLYIIGGALSTMAFIILMLRKLSTGEPMNRLLKPNHFHDLGTLMFAFVVLWAYVNFSQFLIIWAGNLPEETPWYVKRFSGNWNAAAICLMVFHFAVPFFLLLVRFNKKKAAILSTIAIWILCARFLDLAWLIAPAFHEVEDAGNHFIHWMDLAAPIAIGGIWVGVYVTQLGRRSLQPVEVERLAGGHH